MTMKKFIIIPLLLVGSFSFAQNNFLGLFANSYLETAKYGVDKMVRVKKSIYIIYNRDYCKFYVDGQASIFFRTRGYQTKLIGEYLHTEFISEETSTTSDGRYGIMIDENKDGIIFQVNIPSYPGDKVYPNGFTYLVEKAEKYSENGKVNGNIQVLNWNELHLQQQVDDSIRTIRQAEKINIKRQSEIDDSMYIVKRDSLIRIAEDLRYSKGDNYNPVKIEWLADTIAAKVKVSQNDYFYNDFKILIDSNGYVIKAIPNGKQGHIIEKYLPLIDNAIAGIKLKEFKAKNGRYYPSYATLYISLMYDPNTDKKSKKKRLFNF